jgi:flagellar biogenesis protein FliO
VGRTVLDRKTAILLLQVDGRRVLVGVTPHQLTPLSEWEELPEPEVTLEEARQPVVTRFDEAMGRVLGRVRELEASR